VGGGGGHWPSIRSNKFTIEWPPRSGKTREFPKSTAPDGSTLRPRGKSCSQDNAGFLDQLLDHLKASAVKSDVVR
jgi:predicted NUDIX family NTP pyrophosphohydrolase